MKFKEAVDAIINRLSIVDVIGESVTLKRQGSNYVGLCPFHNEKTGSFMVSEAKKIFKCFGCGKGGNVITFYRDNMRVSYREAVIALAKRANIEVEDDYSSNANYKELEEKKNRLYELHKDVANTYYKILYSDKGRDGLKYLRDRKLTDATIKKFGIGFAPNDYGYVYKLMKEKGYDDVLLFESKLFKLHNDKPLDSFYNRIMFPLVDNNKHVIGFQSRLLDPNAKIQKYVNSLDSIIFHKNSFLYAMNFAYYSKKDYYILCEGNMDAITIHQAGFDNAIASMGTAFNEKQMYVLKRNPKKIYLCQDTDDAGVNAVLRSNEILKKAGMETYVINLNPAKDADEFINRFGVDEFTNRLNNPIPTLMFYVSTLKKKYNVSDPYELNKYLNDIVNELFKIDNIFVRDNYTKQIAINEKLDYYSLKNLLDERFKGNSKIAINDVESSNIDENIINYKLSKIDSNFINLIYLLPNKVETIKNIVSLDELIDDNYRFVYKCYQEGKLKSQIYSEIEGLGDDKKKFIEQIINDDLSLDEHNENDILLSLNQIIRQIKIRNLKNNKRKNGVIENHFELRKKIDEINKQRFI